MVRILTSAAALLMFVAACSYDWAGLSAGGSGDGGSDEVRVVSTIPADGDTTADPIGAIEVIFSHPMDAASVSAALAVTGDGGTPIAGTTVYDAESRTAIFQPSGRLVLLGSYTATISVAAKSETGAALASEASFAFRVRDGAWSAEPVRIGQDSGVATGPQIAVSGDGSAMVVWAQQQSIHAVRLGPGGDWSTQVVEIDATSDPAQTPHVAMSPDGAAYAVWRQFDGAEYNIWANRFDPGAGWGTAQPLEGSDADNYAASWPRVAVAADGRAMAAWHEDNGSHFQIRANRSNQAGGWIGEVALEEPGDTGDDSTAPAVVVMKDGNALAVWAHTDVSGTGIWSNLAISGLWLGPESAAPISEGVDEAGIRSDGLAALAGGGALLVGRAIVGEVSPVIAASRYVSGEGWGTLEPLDSGVTSLALPVLAAGPDGSAVALWPREGDIWARRFQPDTGWNTLANVGAASGIAVEDVEPRVVVGPGGHAIAVWRATATTLAWNRLVSGSGWTSYQELGYDLSDVQLAVAPDGTALLVGIQNDQVFVSTFQ